MLFMLIVQVKQTHSERVYQSIYIVVGYVPNTTRLTLCIENNMKGI